MVLHCFNVHSPFELFSSFSLLCFQLYHVYRFQFNAHLWFGYTLNDAIVFGEHLCNRLHINEKLLLKMCEDSITHKISNINVCNEIKRQQRKSYASTNTSIIAFNSCFFSLFEAYFFSPFSSSLMLLFDANYFNQIPNYLSHDSHTQNRTQFETITFELLTFHNDVINFYETKNTMSISNAPPQQMHSCCVLNFNVVRTI